ncbi:MAG: Fic/DOC family N-terminal domain-containing protein [Chitinophagales bacterium]
MLEQASIKLGELNSFARLVPNIDLFIQLHVTKEAVVRRQNRRPGATSS